MDARFYNSTEIDIERIANDLENMYLVQGYQAQQLGNKDQVIVQLKKGGDFEAFLGLQSALSLILQKNSSGTLAMIGQQKWIDKAAVGAVGLVAAPILWPLMLTAGAGAIRQASLGNQVLNVVDRLVQQQKPGLIGGPVPVQLMPQVQQQWSTPSYPQTPQYVPPMGYQPPVPTYTPPKPRCSTCNTPYEPGDTFCSGCGKTLTPPKNYCPHCHVELKDNVAFCPNCGKSTFQAANQQAGGVAAGGPAQPVSPAPTYTPPPAQPAQSQTIPTYTPPPARPQPQPQQPPRPKVEPYVPPTPQAPPVMPKPTVTIQHVQPQNQPPARPQPPRPNPSVPVYVPPVQPQPVAPKNQTPPPPQPIKSRPATNTGIDPNAVWGTLIFEDGPDTRLSGERALVGRYDHDLGGVKPEVDLSNTKGSDTVSRVHAAIEHVGSTFILTDLNSTNSTRVNGKKLEADNPTPISDGDTLRFGSISCTFKKV